MNTQRLLSSLTSLVLFCACSPTESQSEIVETKWASLEFYDAEADTCYGLSLSDAWDDADGAPTSADLDANGVLVPITSYRITIGAGRASKSAAPAREKMRQRCADVDEPAAIKFSGRYRGTHAKIDEVIRIVNSAPAKAESCVYLKDFLRDPDYVEARSCGASFLFVSGEKIQVDWMQNPGVYVVLDAQSGAAVSADLDRLKALMIQALKDGTPGNEAARQLQASGKLASIFAGKL